jgi:hypothetical protein
MAAELSLEALRDEIDKIDEVIVRLLDSRARCAYTIGRLKHELGRPIYEPQRETATPWPGYTNASWTKRGAFSASRLSVTRRRITKNK